MLQIERPKDRKKRKFWKNENGNCYKRRWANSISVNRSRFQDTKTGKPKENIKYADSKGGKNCSSASKVSKKIDDQKEHNRNHLG